MNLEPDWDELLLPQALCSMRCTPAHATKIVPAELLLSRPVVFPFEVERNGQQGEGIIFIFFCFKYENFSFCETLT